MGIPGLINAIGSGERIALSKLAITHLERHARPIRIAVDISIWLFQVQAGRGGKNPELRTLFYRLLKFLALPVHPLFVYDGPHKPPFKRGKAIGGRSYGNAPIIGLSKTLISLFKFPIHEAPGEAEAECARLQRAGIVDAVMSNDVDALMFGSTLTVMNFSKESGSGTTAATHVTCYQMDCPGHPPKVALDRAGMILFAMLSGGDYLPSGVPKCGSKLAAEIARAGFGADLLEALKSKDSELESGLNEWRERLQYELEENESGYFQTKHKAVRIPETFPDRQILSFYANPVVSTDEEVQSLRLILKDAWDQEIDAATIRRFAADTFEWNYRSGARKVIRLLAEPLVSYRLRLRRPVLAFGGHTLLSDAQMPMLQKVYKSRTSFSTDGQSELQLDMVPIDVVGLDLMAEEPNPPMPSQETVGSGDEEEEQELATDPAAAAPTKTRVTKRYDPYASEKVWIFETLVTIGLPDVVEKWKKEQAEKAEKASAPKKTTGRKTGPKKKGPVDPGMRSGSILKYGTLTKPRAGMPPSKQAQLLEAAVSSTTKYSPSSTQSHTSSSSSPTRMEVTQNLHMHQHVSDYGWYRDQDFEGFLDRFSSSCSISHKLSTRRRQMANLSRSDDGCVEALEVSTVESPPRLSSLSGGIRMSYSNAGYRDLAIAELEADARGIAVMDSIAKKKRNGDSKKSSCSKFNFHEAGEIQELESAMVSLSLLRPEESYDERPKVDCCSSTSASTKSKKRPSTKKAVDKEPRVSLREPAASSPVDGDSLPPLEDLLITTPKKASSLAKKHTKDDLESVDSNKPTTHIESILACNGFWSIDTTADTEQVSVKSKTETSQEDSDGKKKKKKRIPRVSILDLS